MRKVICLSRTKIREQPASIFNKWASNILYYGHRQHQLCNYKGIVEWYVNQKIFKIFSERRNLTHTLFNSVEAADKHLLQTLPTGGKFTLGGGGNTAANKSYYGNATTTSKADRVPASTAPSRGTARGASRRTSLRSAGRQDRGQSTQQARGSYTRHPRIAPGRRKAATATKVGARSPLCLCQSPPANCMDTTASP